MQESAHQPSEAPKVRRMPGSPVLPFRGWTGRVWAGSVSAFSQIEILPKVPARQRAPSVPPCSHAVSPEEDQEVRAKTG